MESMETSAPREILAGVATQAVPIDEDHPLFLNCDLSARVITDRAEQLVFGVAVTMLLVVVCGNLIHRARLNFLPESLVSVILGAILGFALYASDWGGERDNLDPKVQYAVFSLSLKLFCLPMIIFESGWSLRQRDFFSQIGYILIIAILGTSISVLVVAEILIYTSEYHHIKDPRTAFAYASLISSTDPVATLATFGAMNVDPLLYILVFGESQINDAVAITLFESINENESDKSLTLGRVVVKICALLFGSLALGIALAIVLILIMRFTRLGRSAHNAILFLAGSPFICYTLAEQVGMSGIITVLFSSIMIGGYAPTHLSAEATTLTSFFLKQLASVGDTVVFVCCGVQAVQYHKEGFVMSLWIMLACVLGRAAAVFPMSLFSNGIKWLVSKHVPAEKQHYISFKHQAMLFHSGLRGGIGLVLSLELGAYVDEDNGPGTKDSLVYATFVMICVYLLVFGGSTAVTLRALQIPYGAEVAMDACLYSSSATESGIFYRWGMQFRRKVLKPLLVGKSADRAQTQEINLTEAVIHDATQRQNSSAFGLRRRSTAAILPDSYNAMSLFGTSDPAHVENVEDAMQQAATGESEALSTVTDSDESFGEECGV